MGGIQYYMLHVSSIVWIHQIFLATVSCSRQSSIVIKSTQKLSSISSLRILRIQVLQLCQLMCWDGTSRVALCFGVAQPFSEEWSSWELPTVLSLVDSYFSNSSFLQGNRKGSPVGKAFCPGENFGFHWAMRPSYLRNDTERQKDYRAANLFKTKQEPNRKPVVPARRRSPPEQKQEG